MANKLTAALKENKNNIRRKVLIVGGVVVATTVAGFVLYRINANSVDLLVVSAEDLAAATTEALPQ